VVVVVALLGLLAQVAVLAVAVAHLILAHLILLVALAHLGKVTLEAQEVVAIQ
jgi:hypothetical protein